MCIRVHRNKSGFSVVELLVILIILVILSSIVLPAVVKAKRNANKLVAVKCLQSLSDALEMYRLDKDSYPDNANALINISPPYIREREIVEATYQSRQPYAGYYFDYTQRGPARYIYSATPSKIGKNLVTYIINEKREIGEQAVIFHAK